MLDKKLRSFLISAFEHLEQQSSAIHSALTEVAAVRNALIELGPEYEHVLARHRVVLTEEAKAEFDAEVREYSSIIQQLRAPGNFV
jgi:hypothetical protein